MVCARAPALPDYAEEMSRTATERGTVELRIGIQHAPRELSFETNESPADIEASVQKAVESGAPLVRFVDEKERVILVATSTLAYVEISAEEPRRVGFIA